MKTIKKTLQSSNFKFKYLYISKNHVQIHIPLFTNYICDIPKVANWEKLLEINYTHVSVTYFPIKHSKEVKLLDIQLTFYIKKQTELDRIKRNLLPQQYITDIKSKTLSFEKSYHLPSLSLENDILIVNYQIDDMKNTIISDNIIDFIKEYIAYRYNYIYLVFEITNL